MSKRGSPQSSTEPSMTGKRPRSNQSISSNSFANSNSNEQGEDEGQGENERNLPRGRNHFISGEAIESMTIITERHEPLNADQPGSDRSSISHNAQSTEHANVNIVGQSVDHHREIEQWMASEQRVQRQIDETTIDVRDLERTVHRLEEQLEKKRNEQEKETDNAKRRSQIHQTHRVKSLLENAFASLESGRLRLLNLKRQQNGYDQLVSKAAELNYTPADGMWILDKYARGDLVFIPPQVTNQNQPVDVANDQIQARGQVQQDPLESIDDLSGQNHSHHQSPEGAQQVYPWGQNQNPPVAIEHLEPSGQQDQSIAGGGLQGTESDDLASLLADSSPVQANRPMESMNRSVLETPTLDPPPPPSGDDQDEWIILDKPTDPS